jgi:hypothetical protein
MGRSGEIAMKVIAGLLVAVVLGGAAVVRPAQAQTVTCALFRSMMLEEDAKQDPQVLATVTCDDIHRVLIVTLTPIAESHRGTPEFDQATKPLREGAMKWIGYTVEFRGPSAASTRPVSGVLLDVSGTGTKKTKTFTVTGDATIQYSWNCGDGPSIFQMFRYHSNGEPADVDANTMQSRGNDTTYIHEHGSFYLNMNTTCTWHVVVSQ